MRTMTEEQDSRLCDEDLGSEESYLEDNGGELMDRLRELEAENSALALANENQREAYERCLDEVANHVVQALLNQKDLREECIKLKMLVFDLERQNRALCELFQQKLPNQPSSAQYQVQVGPRPDCNAQLLNDSSKPAEPAQTEAQAKGNGYHAPQASPGPRSPAASMEALSPFFKKKAHILEVLRKMEETDPLKFHPSTTSLSFCDYSQALLSTEAVLITTDALPLQCKPRHTHCHCSHPDAQQHVNGVEGATCEGAHGCLQCKRSADSNPKPCSHVCSPSKATSSTQVHVVPPAAASECHSKKRATLSGPPKQCLKNEGHQQPASTATPTSASQIADQSLEAIGLERETPDSCVNVSASEELTAHSAKNTAQISNFDVDDSLTSANATEPNEPPTVPEIDGTDQKASAVRAGASVSPSPSCLSDVKAAAMNSPSKLLKFLKIPSIGEKSQVSNSAVRLSPQLTRNSRIPCRTNNYEVYHSPVPTRRATTTERCRQPPPPPARSESYPTTHSAPTSPPQPEDICSTPSYSGHPASSHSIGLKMGGPSSASSSSPKASQSVPHYENVCEMSAHTTQSHDKRTTLPSQTKVSGGERKLVKSLPESVLNPAPQRKQSSSSTSESTSDEEDSESPVWLGHHSVPRCSAPVKDQNRTNFSRPRQTRDADIGEVLVPSSEVTQPLVLPLTRRNESSSIPKRPTNSTARAPADSSHHAFKDRLAALGKLRSSEDLQGGLRSMMDPMSESTYAVEKSRTAERSLENQKEEQRQSKLTDSLDSKPKSSIGGLKHPGSSQLYEQALRSQTSLVKPELVAKSDGSKSKIGHPSSNADAPQVLRNSIKCPGSLNLVYGAKPGVGPHSTSSPNKIPPKSPSKPCHGPSVYKGGKPSEAPRYSSKSEERTKNTAKGKKNPMYGDSLPPPPSRPPTTEAEKSLKPVPSPQSAIEQKVMKGIEENMLKLQEQDRGGQGGEVKQKTSNGIASWFGLKKSKLPALNRKTDATKAKDEKKEWKINIPSVGRDSVKMATRCKEGVEGLNISTLMEKAEGLRRALEEERAYVERSGRGHSCEVVMDQAQGQLAVMYRGARSDNFMQQLLNRVDGKEAIGVPQRRLSFDCKASKAAFSQQNDATGHTCGRRDVEKGSEPMRTSEENLADPLHSHHFAGSGASTYTLDSGIGTFPLPDCSSGAAGRGVSKMSAGAKQRSSDSPGRGGRRARTLERELTLPEECYVTHQHLVPAVQYGPGPETRTHVTCEEEAQGVKVFSPRSKTWTFPNLKTPAGPEVYLAVEEEEEGEEEAQEARTFGSPFRGSVKSCGPSSSRGCDPNSLPAPPQSVKSRRGKTCTSGVPEMSREAGLELLRERPEEALCPSHPQVLETPESLSDSLYDSLSSCGSQG